MSTTAPSRSAPPSKPPPKYKPVEASAVCPRIVFYAIPGFGKTTLAAYAPSPLILMARDESGVKRLVQSGSIPNVPAHRCATWTEGLAVIDDLIDNQQGFETLALDAIGGFERLCHEHVCRRDFNNNETNFDAYGKGPNVSVGEWLKLQQKLDKLNDAGVTVLLLGHSRVKPFKNPEGPDYDMYQCDVHEKTWGCVSRWADAVLFGNFFVAVDKSSPSAAKGKAQGGTERFVYTEKRAAFDAKNGYRMEPKFILPDDASQSWATLWAQLTANTKENGQ